MNILIADEFAIYRFVIKSYVNKCWPNANVFEVGTLREVIDEVEKNSFDLVVLDIHLPGSQGLEEFLAKVGRSLEIVLFSEDPIDAFKAERLRDFGVDRLLLKSTHSRDVIESLQTIFVQAKLA